VIQPVAANTTLMMLDVHVGERLVTIHVQVGEFRWW